MYSMSGGDNAAMTNKQDKGIENDLGMEGASEGLSDFLMRQHVGRDSEVRDQLIQKSS